MSDEDVFREYVGLYVIDGQTSEIVRTFDYRIFEDYMHIAILNAECDTCIRQEITTFNRVNCVTSVRKPAE